MERSFAELEREAANAQTLDDLFILWQKAHIVDPNWEETFPKTKGVLPDESFKASFMADGVSCELGNYNKESGNRKTADIVFVLKESDVLDENGSASNSFGFWFDEAVECNSGKNKPKKAIAVRNRYMKKFSGIMDRYCSDWDSYTPIGYMNLNKRGGFSKANYYRLKAYVRQYHRFILKEIEILSPKTIVLCGCVGELVLGLMEANDLRLDIFHEPDGSYQILNISSSVTPKIVTTCHPAAYTTFYNAKA